VIAHDPTSEESLLAKIKRNQEHRRRLFEIHQKIQSLSPTNQLLSIPNVGQHHERERREPTQNAFITHTSPKKEI
jgi:hypothetical protein